MIYGYYSKRIRLEAVEVVLNLVQLRSVNELNLVDSHIYVIMFGFVKKSGTCH